MNGSTILAVARAAGLTIAVRDGKLSIHGAGGLPTDLIETIRGHKVEVIALLEAESANKASKEKKGIWPVDIVRPANLLLLAVMPGLPSQQRDHLIALVMGEGQLAINWCSARANAYFEKFPESGFDEQDAAAAQDYFAAPGAPGAEG